MSSHPDLASAPPDLNPVDLLIDERYLADSAAATRQVRTHALRILAALGLWQQTPAAPLPAAALAAALGVQPAVAFAFAWLLEEAVLAGAVAAGGGPAGDPAARLYRPLAAPAAGDLALPPVADPAGLGSSLPMFAHIAERYPDYLRGDRSGAAILLKGPALRLWEDYFSDANPLYDVHNRLGWAGLCRALEPWRRSGRPCRVLELGAGTGGGTAAILAGLAQLAERGEAVPRVRLTISDVAPSFLLATVERLAPRAAALAPAVALEKRRLDFGRPLAEQGVEAGSVDVLVGVNALHNGSDLAAVLQAVRPALAPDGALVVSESLCGPGEQVHQEIVFNLLPLAGQAAGGGRPRSRFHAAEVWQEALAGAGFAAEVFRNGRGPQLALLAIARPAAPAAGS